MEKAVFCDKQLRLCQGNISSSIYWQHTSISLAQLYSIWTLAYRTNLQQHSQFINVTHILL